MGLAAKKLLCLIFMAAVCVGQNDWAQCSAPCSCKWVSGKKTADCNKKDLTQIPNNLSSEIQNLNLSGNRLMQVPRHAFLEVNLVNLHKIILRGCGIESVDVDAFDGLKIVTEIDLSANDIRTLSPGTFLNTQRLSVLLLNQNQIEILEDGLFHNLTYLQRVEISDNKLESIGQKTFHNLAKFNSLTLDGNNLSVINLRNFEKLNKLTTLQLRNNPWNCNCHLKEFRDWSIERKLYTRPTTCTQPPHLAGKMWDEVDSNDFACRPKISFIGLRSRSQAIVEVSSGNVTLCCHVSGIPHPKATWLHGSKKLDNTTRRYSGNGKGYELSEQGDWMNLTIPDITPSDKGEYNCRAVNPGGIETRNITLTVIGGVIGSKEGSINLPLALGLGLTALLLLIVTLCLCIYYCRRRRISQDEKSEKVIPLERRGLREQEKSLITAINPVVKPPRRYEAPSVTSHGTETTELNRTLLDNDSVFAAGVGDDERERATPELDSGAHTRATSYRQYPPDLLAFSGGREPSPTSQASTAPDSSRLPTQLSSTFGSPTTQYPIVFKTLPHNRSAAPYSAGPPVMPRHGYVTIPRRPRAPSWSSAPPCSLDGLEPVYDNLGLRTTADGSSVLSLNKSPEPLGVINNRPLPGTPSPHYTSIQRSTPNILMTSPLDRVAPEGAPEWSSELSDESNVQFLGGTLGRKVPPRPPPKPKKKSTDGPLYEDEGEDGTEV